MPKSKAAKPVTAEEIARSLIKIINKSFGKDETSEQFFTARDSWRKRLNLLENAGFQITRKDRE